MQSFGPVDYKQAATEFINWVSQGFPAESNPSSAQDFAKTIDELKNKQLTQQENTPQAFPSFSELLSSPDHEKAFKQAIMQAALEKDDGSLMAILLTNGIIQPDYEALKNAAKAGKWNSVTAFVKHHPESDTEECKHAYGFVLLHGAKNSQKELVNTLLDKSPEMTWSFSDGEYQDWGALHFAIANNQTEWVTKLIENHQVDPNLQFIDGPAPLQVAFSNNNTEMVQLLMSKGATVDYAEFKADADAGRWDRVRAFVKNNPEDVSVEACADAYGDVILDAVKNKQIDLVNSLLGKKASCDWHYTSGEHQGWSVMHFAVAQGNTTLVTRLLSAECKVDPDEQFKNGPTPWQVAFNQKQKNESMIKLLLSSGAKPDYTVLKQYAENNYYLRLHLFLQYTPYNANHPECVSLYNELYLEAKKNKTMGRVEALQKAGVNKDAEVDDFLLGKEFTALERYLVKTQEHDALADDSSWGWKQMKKHDVLNAFVNKLKACGTMDEVREVYRDLEAPNEKNPGKISDYAFLNTARGWGYRFFGLNTTTIGRIDDLKALVPPVASAKKLK